ncbi:unnamed protein product [Chondrus crispus]|uniref:Uncharacterized protein n=1 Tax=Chondrus crispus TaxID=2769 RepID=R7Q5S6_CHOCR|nr:unnamed protein product [Chondrus crispus]CDF32820.1 unnamed protein product [Chondrus crispus]|eukprot:XP_005712621.1 unnamed protein product [Chondrus crispus]
MLLHRALVLHFLPPTPLFTPASPKRTSASRHGFPLPWELPRRHAANPRLTRPRCFHPLVQQQLALRLRRRRTACPQPKPSRRPQPILCPNGFYRCPANKRRVAPHKTLVVGAYYFVPLAHGEGFSRLRLVKRRRPGRSFRRAGGCYDTGGPNAAYGRRSGETGE